MQVVMPERWGMVIIFVLFGANTFWDASFNAEWPREKEAQARSVDAEHKQAVRPFLHQSRP